MAVDAKTKPENNGDFETVMLTLKYTKTGKTRVVKIDEVCNPYNGTDI